MNSSPIKYNDAIRMNRIGLGACFESGPCYVCGQRANGFYELPERPNVVFYLCEQCKDSYDLVRMALSAQCEQFYMHSRHGQIVKIRRSSGKIHNAKLMFLVFGFLNGKKFGHVRCIWNEDALSCYHNTNDNSQLIPSHDFFSTTHNYSTRMVDYKTLKELNPDLPELTSVPVFGKFNIHESFQKKVDDFVSCMKEDKELPMDDAIW
jgi:hypothetical protein